MKTLSKTLIGWIIGFLFACYLDLQPPQAFDFSSPLMWLAEVIVGVFLAVWALRLLWQRQWKVLPFSAFLLPVILLPFYFTVGYDLMDGFRSEYQRWIYLREIAGYERIVARIPQPPRGQVEKTVNGQQMFVEAGPPLRVNFPQPGGILDNYRAVVYDPSGSVMKINNLSKAEWRSKKYASLKGLFGGDLIWAEHLKGPWYLCGFT